MDGPARARDTLGTRVLFSLATAIVAVGHNKLRAALTSLGILFGVASVIAMLAIGKGAEQEILEQMRLLGSNNILVTPLEEQKEELVSRDEGKKEPKKYSPGLTFRDAEAIRMVVPHVDRASAEVVLNSLISREGRRRSGKVVGVDTSHFHLLNLTLAQGNWFTTQQVAQGRPVAIIGHGIRTRFFTTEDPIGKSIKAGEIWLTVVGVLDDRTVSKETSERLGVRDPNMDVYVPVHTMLMRFRNRAQLTQRDIELAARPEQNNDPNAAEEDPDVLAEKRNYHQLDRIVVRVDEASFVAPVAEILQRMLSRRHNQVIDFEITVPELLLKQEQRTKTIFNIVLGAIASISLVVGGIGIMNIMLASVLERIREIGVRRAMGATQKDILAQFLSEAMIISVAGGVAGIITGVALSVGIEKFAGIATMVSLVSVAVAFGVSITVGLVFGIVPAYRAARQDPVVCLRYE
ncbi:MAG: ABC transporter permease [Cytophagaceae bacterium]|nr:ABC transporter permease [Gemmatimonadaceae bacterium]